MSNRRPIKLKIASPCTADWDRMTGDEAVRFCGKCKKNVYQLSEMTTAQVESLLEGPGERPCVRFYQRKDGSVLTEDCPVGARRVRRKRIAVGLGAGALSALGLALSPGPALTGPPEPLMGAMEPQVEETAAVGELPPAPETIETIETTELVQGEPVLVEPQGFELDSERPVPRMGRPMIRQPDDRE